MNRQKNGTWKLSDIEMNLLSIYAYEAKKCFDRVGKHALADKALETHNAIYEILEKAGYYKE